MGVGGGGDGSKYFDTQVQVLLVSRQTLFLLLRAEADSRAVVAPHSHVVEAPQGSFQERLALAPTGGHGKLLDVLSPCRDAGQLGRVSRPKLLPPVSLQRLEVAASRNRMNYGRVWFELVVVIKLLTRDIGPGFSLLDLFVSQKFFLE